MGLTGWPGEEDEDAYISVDWREEESDIVSNVAERLVSGDTLTVRFGNSEADFFVSYRGKEYRVPLTVSPADRYVAISSLAEILKTGYAFYLNSESLDSDTHELLVAPRDASRQWGPLPRHLTPLKLGRDYFGEGRIPYVNHEETAADTSRRLNMAALSRILGTLFMDAALRGKVDPQQIRAAAQSIATTPKLIQKAGFPAGATAADIEAQLRRELDAIASDPEVKKAQRTVKWTLAWLRLRIILIGVVNLLRLPFRAFFNLFRRRR